MPNQLLENSPRKTSDIQDWLVSYLADLLEVEPEEVDINTTFARYGLDSSAAVVIAGDLEDFLGIELEPTLLYDYPTITELAKNLAVES